MLNQKRSEEILLAFNPIRVFLKILGLLPFEIVKKSDGTYAYKFKMSNPSTIIFISITVIYSIFFGAISFGIFCFIVDFYPGTYQIPIRNQLGEIEQVPWEEAIILNNVVVLIVFWTWLTMAFFATMYILNVGNEYVHYFNYWNKVVQIIDMDITVGIKRYIQRELVEFVLYLIIFTMAFCYVSSIRASCGVISCLLFRFIFRDLASYSWFVLMETLGFVIVTFGYAASKALIMQFDFFIIILRNAVRTWNYRLLNALNGPNYKMHHSECEKRRTSYGFLVKDHLIIVQLFKMTEDTYSLVLEAFYFMMIICLTIEAIQIYVLLGPGQVRKEIIGTRDRSFSISVPKIRPKPKPLSEEEIFQQNETFIYTIVCIILFAHTAMRGFEIIRRHGFMNCKNNTEKNLLHTLVVSYARCNPVDITTGYFSVDKALLTSIVGTVVSYFLLLTQFPLERYPVTSYKDLRLKWGAPDQRNGDEHAH